MIVEKIELKIYDSGEGNLNFWDWAHGNDVIADIKNGELFLNQFDENSQELPSKPITFSQYLDLVKESVKKRKI